VTQCLGCAWEQPSQRGGCGRNTLRIAKAVWGESLYYLCFLEFLNFFPSMCLEYSVIKKYFHPRLVVPVCNPSTRDMDKGGPCCNSEPIILRVKTTHHGVERLPATYNTSNPDYTFIKMVIESRGCSSMAKHV
jgi:hypothetical protein